MPADHPVIFCVDDDPDVLSFLEAVLESGGYTFVGATSGEEALRQIRRVQPDLLIVDLMMEEVDSGVSLVRELRLLGNTAPVYLLSSVGDSLDETVDSAELGLRGVLQKPPKPEVLLALVESVLRVREDLPT